MRQHDWPSGLSRYTFRSSLTQLGRWAISKAQDVPALLAAPIRPTPLPAATSVLPDHPDQPLASPARAYADGQQPGSRRPPDAHARPARTSLSRGCPAAAPPGAVSRHSTGWPCLPSDRRRVWNAKLAAF